MTSTRRSVGTVASWSLAYCVQLGQPLAIGGRVRSILVGVRRIELGQRVGSRRRRLAPQRHIEPDVRIARAVLVGQHFVRGDLLGDGDGRLAAAHPLEQLGQLAFQVQAGIEDDVGPVELADVGRRRLVEMRIDALAHQRRHRDVLAADVRREVRHHARRADDADRIRAGSTCC